MQRGVSSRFVFVLRLIWSGSQSTWKCSAVHGSFPLLLTSRLFLVLFFSIKNPSFCKFVLSVNKKGGIRGRQKKKCMYPVSVHGGLAVWGKAVSWTRLCPAGCRLPHMFPSSCQGSRVGTYGAWCLEIRASEAGEVSQGLGVSAALAENQRWIPSTNVVANNGL